MNMTEGLRITWPSDNTPHWQIRRGFTVANYDSPEFLRLKKKAIADVEVTRRNDYFETIYDFSCLQAIEIRFGFYERMMPASNYRRTSIDFDMTPTKNSRIGAFVESAGSRTIQLNHGTIVAIEDASQLLLAIWKEPIDIDFNEQVGIEDNILPLRVVVSGLNNPFYDYSDVISPSDLSAELFQVNETVDYYKSLPRQVLNNFLAVSGNLSRQIFADNLSILSGLWVIAHEDAHKYSGHLQHFAQMGVMEQDALFHELIATIEDKTLVAARRAAELEADTCATMRAVDYFFDNEFLAIITDHISPHVRGDIYLGEKRSSTLNAEQRLLILRLITVSSILPLVIFEGAILNNASNNISNYPTFVTRAVNIIFTVASRALDVMINYPDHGVGMISSAELPEYFSCAVRDLVALYSVLVTGMGDAAAQRKQLLPENLHGFASKLTTAFFASHGNGHLLGIRNKLDRTDFKLFPQIADFIVERQLMYRSRVETFRNAKMAANMTRQNKVEEDIQISLENIKRAENAFSFL